MMLTARGALLFCLVAVLVGGCATVERALEARKPEVSIDGVRLDSADFSSARVVFDVAIDNPNPVGIELAGFDYTLALNGTDFLSGREDRSVSLPAEGSETIPVPLDISFARVSEVVGSLGDSDRVDYALDLGLDVDVPAVGPQRVTTSTDGSVPIPQRPSISLKNARVASLGFSGAQLILEVAVDNPNGFGIDIDYLDYAFVVNGQRWAGDTFDQGIRLAGNDRSILELPLAVSLNAIGASAFDLLQGGARVDYELRADLSGAADLEGLGDFHLPLKRTGRIDLGR